MEKSLGILANKEKICALMAYICKKMGEVRFKNMLKIIYFIDEKAVLTTGHPITWLDYYAWKKGPVPYDVYCMKETPEICSEYITITLDKNEKRIVTSANVDEQTLLQEFSDDEITLIDSIIEECKAKTFEELSDRTHSEGSLWKNTAEANGLLFIDSDKTSVKLDFSQLVTSNEELSFIYADAKDCMVFQAAIKKTSC